MKTGIHFLESDDQIPEGLTTLLYGERITKASLLRGLAIACHFPDYFGNNWDAAWESLVDCEDLLLLLKVEPSTEVSQADLDTFIDMIDDAFREYGHPQLWILGYKKTLRSDEVES